MFDFGIGYCYRLYNQIKNIYQIKQYIDKIYNSNVSIKKVVKKTMINSDITSIDIIDKPLYKNNDKLLEIYNKVINDNKNVNDTYLDILSHDTQLSIKEYYKYYLTLHQNK